MNPSGLSKQKQLTPLTGLLCPEASLLHSTHHSPGWGALIGSRSQKCLPMEVLLIHRHMGQEDDESLSLPWSVVPHIVTVARSIFHGSPEENDIGISL